MSEEFQKVARQEIHSELESLGNILVNCTTDEKIHLKSEEIEKHMHNIKGLAPMIGFENMGDLARISDVIVKHIIRNGQLSGSHMIISEAILNMKNIFNKNSEIDTIGFASKAREKLPGISGI